MKDMSVVYFEMNTKALLRLRSQKWGEKVRLENKNRGMLENRDLRVLKQQIIWINAVLESRDCQIPLPYDLT